MADDEERLTPHEHQILKTWDEAGLGDPDRVKVLKSLIEGAQAWGYTRRFLIQLGLATGAIAAIATAIFALRDWFSR